MKLIDLLVRDLPKYGGWPEDLDYCWQDWDKELRPRFSFGFNLDELAENYRACGELNPEPNESNAVTREEYEEAVAKLAGEDSLPPIGTIVQGLPLDAPSFEKPFMFIINCIHDGVFIGEAMAGGKVFGELSRWNISRVPSKEETHREEALFDINKLIGDIEKYPTWRDAVCGIYDAISAGDIRGLRAE